MGSVKDIQAHLRHAKADTTANEYMQELPESVVQMVGAVYEMLRKGGAAKRRKRLFRDWTAAICCQSLPKSRESNAVSY